MTLVESLSRHLESGALDELTLTTNGARLRGIRPALAQAGVRRINVSLDTLDRAIFARIARGDCLPQVLAGIAAAQDAGLKVKINTVALERDNAAEMPRLIQWAHDGGMDITLIETMPLGEVDEDRTRSVPVAGERCGRSLKSFWTLNESLDRTGGPARYVRVAETGGRLGFITPLSHNFCEACNRVRLTCTGTLFMCLGPGRSGICVRPLRGAADDDAAEFAAIDRAVAAKPKSHDFLLPGAARQARRRPAHVHDRGLTWSGWFFWASWATSRRPIWRRLPCLATSRPFGLRDWVGRTAPLLGRAMAAHPDPHGVQAGRGARHGRGHQATATKSLSCRP